MAATNMCSNFGSKWSSPLLTCTEVHNLSFAYNKPSTVTKKREDCKIMPGRRCMAAGCSNTARGVNIFNFPKNEEV